MGSCQVENLENLHRRVGTIIDASKHLAFRGHLQEQSAVAGGSESLVLQSLRAGLWGGWTLAGRKVIYATPGDRGGSPSDLKVLDLETGRTRSIASLRFPPVEWDGSVGLSPDGRYALVAEVERQGSEIHLQADR